MSEENRVVVFKRTIRGLDTIQTVYAVAMGVGITQVFVGSQTFLTELQSGTQALFTAKTLLIALLLANITLLGLRFFWVPRNLHALVYDAAKANPALDIKGIPVFKLSNWSIAFHMVVIFAHGALFYLICSEFEFVVFIASSHLPIDPSVVTGYVVMHVCLLVMNAAWIGIVSIQRANLKPVDGSDAQHQSYTAGEVWWRNNLIAGLFALAPFAIISSCPSEIARCLAQSDVDTPFSIVSSPLAPAILSVVYDTLIGQFMPNSSLAQLAIIVWALAVFLVNSAVDLVKTGRDYLLLEDVEWETAQPTKVEPSK